MAKKNRKRTVQPDKYKERQKASLRSMYFNRFLMCRYFLATFFFTNFFWTILSWGDSVISWISLGMLVFGALPVWEMGKMYGVTKPAITFTRIYFRLQWIVCLASCVLVWTTPFNFLYPFFNETTLTKSFGFIVPLIGLGMATLCVRRINQIDAGNDRQLQRIEFFETKYNLHI